MDIVDKIYNLILKDGSEETFNKHPELFQEFYYHHMSIQTGGSKVISIYKYLLSLNIDEEHETMPFINSKIFEDFNRYEQYVTQSVYLKDTKIDDDYVEKLFKLMSTYLEFEKYKDQANLDKLIDYNKFIRDCTGCMIVMLNSSFFDLSDGHITAMNHIIKRNRYLFSMINGNNDNQLLDQDYIFQYVSRYLFTVEFLSEGDLSEDLLVEALLDSKIKDKKTLMQIFKYANSNHIVDIFDEDMSLFTDVLEDSLEDDFDRQEVFSYVFSKLKKDGKYTLLFDYVISDDRMEKYISEEDKQLIIDEFLNHYPTDITTEEVNYIIDKDLELFNLINLKTSLKDNDWDDETRSRVQELTKDITEYDYDFETSIEVLDKLFRGNEEIDEFMVIGALKGLAKNYLGVDEVNFYLFRDDKTLGCTNGHENTISINYNSIEKIVNSKNHDMIPEVLSVIQTVFHEARHVQQFSGKKENLSDDLLLFFKEELLSDIVSNYYSKNYIGVSFERDARIVGAQATVELLKTYFPYMEKSIEYYDGIESKEKEAAIEAKGDQEKKSMFELSEDLTVDEMITKLVSLNPMILEDYPILEKKSIDVRDKSHEINEMLENDNHEVSIDNVKSI